MCGTSNAVSIDVAGDVFKVAFDDGSGRSSAPRYYATLVRNREGKLVVEGSTNGLDVYKDAAYLYHPVWGSGKIDLKKFRAFAAAL